MGRLGGRQILGDRYKSRRPLHNALYQGVPTRYGRHRSPCMYTVKARLETNRTCSMNTDPTPIGRTRPCFDVEPSIARARDTHKINADKPTDARTALCESAICELLGHDASQTTQATPSGAKNTPPLKLPVTGHDLRPLEQSRGGAWWPTVHGVRKPRLRHGKALPAAPTHVVELTRMFGFNRCACS